MSHPQSPDRSIRLALAAALLISALPGCFSGTAGEAPRGPATTATPSAAAIAPRGPFASGPYVQSVTPEGGLVAYAYGRSVVTTAYAGLAPDTEVPYRITGPDGVTATGTFKTAPLPGSRPIVFGVVGDSGQPEDPHVHRITAAMARSQPALELVLHTGDVVYPRGEWESWGDAFFAPFAPLARRIPFYFTIGNHDTYTEAGAAFDAYTFSPANNPARDESYYSFDWGDVHFVALDLVRAGYHAGTPQRRWLEDDLAQAMARPWTVVFFHYTVFGEERHGDMLDFSTELAPLFTRLGVDVVLSGHEHAYERFHPVAGVHYLVTGGGGARLRELNAASRRLAASRSAHHFLRGRADARSLTIEAVDGDGAVFDRLALTR